MAKRHFHVNIPKPDLYNSLFFLNAENASIHPIVQTSNPRFVLDSTLSLIPFQHPTPQPFPSLPHPKGLLLSFHFMVPSLLTLEALVVPMSALTTATASITTSPIATSFVSAAWSSERSNRIFAECSHSASHSSAQFPLNKSKHLIMPCKASMSCPLHSSLPQLPSFSPISLGLTYFLSLNCTCSFSLRVSEHSSFCLQCSTARFCKWLALSPLRSTPQMELLRQHFDFTLSHHSMCMCVWG